MDELILQTLSGRATPSVEEEVRRWRAASPENESYYRSTAAVWEATAPAPLAAAVAPVDPQVILAEAARRRAAEVRPESGPADHERAEGPAGERAAGRVRTAAPAPVLSLTRHGEGGRRAEIPPAVRKALLLAAGVAAVAIAIRGLTREPGFELPAAGYATDAGAPRTVALDDGSFVRLAAGSVIEARITENGRTVTLTGRAFFAVAHDEARPFTVRAGVVETRVLGTRFEVAESEGAVRTVVVDGRVAVSNPYGEVEVPAGSLARAPADSAPTTERPADIDALLDWPGGLLLFQGTPLGRVADEVGRAFDRSVVVESEALRALRITGSFEHQDFEEVVEALCDAAGAICTVNAAGAVISPRESRP